MAKIVEYTAPKTDLRPSDLGFTATEQSGRLLGNDARQIGESGSKVSQEYNAAAANIRQVGASVLDAAKLTAQVLEEQRFIFELRSPNVKLPSTKGGSVRVGGLGKGSGWPWDNQGDVNYNKNDTFTPDSNFGSKSSPVASFDPTQGTGINTKVYDISGPFTDLTSKLSDAWGDGINMQPATPAENLPPPAMVPDLTSGGGIPMDATEANSIASPDAGGGGGGNGGE